MDIRAKLAWDEAITDLIVVADRDRIAVNTRNDYGLPPGYIFLAGRHVHGDALRPSLPADWYTAWARLSDAAMDAVTPWLCDRRAESAAVRHWAEHGWQLIVADPFHIAHARIQLTTAPPEHFERVFTRPAP